MHFVFLCAYNQKNFFCLVHLYISWVSYSCHSFLLILREGRFSFCQNAKPCIIWDITWLQELVLNSWSQHVALHIDLDAISYTYMDLPWKLKLLLPENVALSKRDQTSWICVTIFCCCCHGSMQLDDDTNDNLQLVIWMSWGEGIFFGIITCEKITSNAFYDLTLLLLYNSK